MNPEILYEEELEELNEEAREKEVAKAINDMVVRYKALFGSEPDMSLPPAEIEGKIREEMIRRNLRPYKL